MAKPRLIVVDGDAYRFRVTQRYSSARGCVTKFMAFRDGTTSAALRLSFADGPLGDHGGVHAPSGVVTLAGHAHSINLNRPVVAEAIIRRAVANGWPTVDGDGFALLASISDELAPEAEHVA